MEETEVIVSEDTMSTKVTRKYQKKSAEEIRHIYKPLERYEDKRRDILIQELIANRGNVTDACERVGLSYTAHARLMAIDDYYAARYKEIIESRTDFVEKKLMENIDKNDIVAIKFYLQCQAKARGWVERHDVNLNGIFKQVVIKDNLDEE